MSQLSLIERMKARNPVLTVSALTAQIKNLVETRFVDVWVEGEISNFKRHSSGHWYFTLKDDAANIKCACFRMQNQYLRFLPDDGMKVRARGRISLYEARGDYQLVVEFLDPTGAGALQVAFEQLKQRLGAEGLFEAARKRPLPMFPSKIGIVTSPTGAALHDILRILKRRNAGVSVLIAPVKVQGAGAALEISRAISLLNDLAEVDVIIVGRGGGSIEDLWPFNEESVARAIFRSAIPVIAAVGHETDVTIADFVADLRASTPSAAAEIVTVVREEMCARLGAVFERMGAAMRYRMLEKRNRLAALESSRGFSAVPLGLRTMTRGFDEAVHSMESHLRAAIRRDRSALHRTASRLRQADVRRVMTARAAGLQSLRSRMAAVMNAMNGRNRKRFSVAASKLHSLSPLRVLARGYSIAFSEDGAILKQAAEVAIGSRIKVVLGRGEMDCSVEKVREEPAPRSSPEAAAPK